MEITKGGDNEKTPEGQKALGATENTPMAPRKAPEKSLAHRFLVGGSSQVVERSKGNFLK